MTSIYLSTSRNYGISMDFEWSGEYAESNFLKRAVGIKVHMCLSGKDCCVLKSCLHCK